MGSLTKNCKTPGCPNLHRNKSGYCDECMARYAAAHPEKGRPAEDRPSAYERGYTSKWRRFARNFLINHPVCAICGAPSTCVDHKNTPADVMLEVNGGVFDYDEREYQALCCACNAEKGKTLDRKRRARYYADKARLGLGGGSEKNARAGTTGAVRSENCAGGKF